MERTNFENLRVYKLAEDLADQIWVIVRKWDYLSRDTVGKQIIKAADSIGANIAEGTGQERLKTTEDSYEWLGDRCTKLSIGYAEPISECF
jgi:four helix bundle protein